MALSGQHCSCQCNRHHRRVHAGGADCQGIREATWATGRSQRSVAGLGDRLTDETPVLTLEDVRREAREILRAIDVSRDHPAPFQANWRKLWQLVREAKAAYLPVDGSNGGPWHLSSEPDQELDRSLVRLTAGKFAVAIWPPEAARAGTDLPRLLNWAGVPVPGGR
jgi:hypothetical protein